MPEEQGENKKHQRWLAHIKILFSIPLDMGKELQIWARTSARRGEVSGTAEHSLPGIKEQYFYLQLSSSLPLDTCALPHH